MKNFFGLGLFLLGAVAILIFGLPAMFSHPMVAASVILIGFVAAFFSASFADTTVRKQISVAAALRIGLFVLAVVLALVGLVNIFTDGRTAAGFYLFVVGLLGAFAAAAAAWKQLA